MKDDEKYDLALEKQVIQRHIRTVRAERKKKRLAEIKTHLKVEGNLYDISSLFQAREDKKKDDELRDMLI